MSGRRLRSLLVLATVAAGAAKVARSLRGDPAPVFAGGGHSTDARAASGVLTAPMTPLAPAPPEGQGAPAPSPAPPAVEPPVPADAPLEDRPPATEPEPAPSDGAIDGFAAPATAGEGPPVAAAWVPPVDGACPDGYPIKAKVRSGIFHRPGMSAYGRTTPDRCYPDEATAEADGLRPAKR